MSAHSTPLTRPSNDAPVVSVVVPTYNRRPLVAEAINSVLAQTYSLFELIVVDDGSTDGTSDDVQQFGQRLRLLRQERKGVSAARNFGVQASHGRLLAFLDSDDLWLPDKLAAQLDFLEKRPEYEICQTEEIWMRNGVRVNPKAKHRKPAGDAFRRSLDLCLISPSAVMLTRRLFDEVGGFDEAFPVCEDYDLWLRISARYPVGLFSHALMVKRGGHDDQLSQTWGMDRYRVAALLKLLRDGLPASQRAWALAALRRKIGILVQGTRKRGKSAEALAYEAMLAEFNEESVNAGAGNSRLCTGEGISSADARALAFLG